MGLLAESHVAGSATQIVSPTGRALANVGRVGHLTSANDCVCAVGLSRCRA